MTRPPLVLTWLSLAVVTATATARVEIRLNTDWQFRPGLAGEDVRPEALPEDGWQTVQLPHDAAIYGPFTRSGSDSANGWRPRGAGVYRKTLTLPAAAGGQRVLLEFQGVYRDARVWINGHLLTRQLHGSLGFEVDLSPYVSEDRPNVLVVAYDNRRAGTARWYTGEGIDRDVWLRILDPVHVARHGTAVTTPCVSDDRATVHVQTEVTNAGTQTAWVRLVSEIRDPQGRCVATAPAVAPVAGGDTRRFRQDLSVPAPQRWDLATPRLYRLRSQVFRDGRPADTYETRFGIRTIVLTAARGLLLNGRKVIAKGGNLHHDLGCLGSAALKAGYEQIIRELKAIGCNSFRLAHDPHPPVLLDVCDEQGILIFDEAYDKWTSQYYGGEVSFESRWRQDLARFLRRDRNHPCVYIWSMGNEVRKQQGRYEPPFETAADAADYGAGLLRRMVDFTHRLEPSRPVTVGLFPSREKAVKEWEHWDDPETFRNARPAEMAFEADVVSWNYTENLFARDHRTYPQFRFIASEASPNLDFGDRRPSWLEMDPNYVIGHYVWSGYDYLGESPWPQKSWGRSLIDLAGWVTPIGRYYQSFYSETPVVHLMVRETDPGTLARFAAIENKRWNWYPMVDHWTWPGRTQAEVTTFTNCETVELLLNGRSLGTRRRADGPDGRIDWQVPYAPGTLCARGRCGNAVVAEHLLRSAGEPVRIALEPARSRLRADGLDVVYVDVTLRDARGTLVPHADRRLRFAVAGPAVNAGVANGNVISDEPWQADTRRTWNGRCRLVLRAGRTPGTVTVTASAPGLAPGTLSLPCERGVER